jgi:hypothetical protein
VTCRPVFRKHVVKHVSAEIRFLDRNHRWVLNKGNHGYENVSCIPVESSSFAVESTGESKDMSKQEILPRIPVRYIGGRADKK